MSASDDVLYNLMVFLRIRNIELQDIMIVNALKVVLESGPGWESVTLVVGGEIGNLVPWGDVSPHCVFGRE